MIDETLLETEIVESMTEYAEKPNPFIAESRYEISEEIALTAFWEPVGETVTF